MLACYNPAAPNGALVVCGMGCFYNLVAPSGQCHQVKRFYQLRSLMSNQRPLLGFSGKVENNEIIYRVNTQRSVTSGVLNANCLLPSRVAVTGL